MTFIFDDDWLDMFAERHESAMQFHSSHFVLALNVLFVDPCLDSVCSLLMHLSFVLLL